MQVLSKKELSTSVFMMELFLNNCVYMCVHICVCVCLHVCGLGTKFGHLPLLLLTLLFEIGFLNLELTVSARLGGQ